MLFCVVSLTFWLRGTEDSFWICHVCYSPSLKEEIITLNYQVLCSKPNPNPSGAFDKLQVSRRAFH